MNSLLRTAPAHRRAVGSSRCGRGRSAARPPARARAIPAAAPDSVTAPFAVMASAAATQAQEAAGASVDEAAQSLPARSYRVVVWNDPVNLMSYVSWVFRSYFGHSRARAYDLMMRVHEQGRAVVASGSRERAERDVHAMHHYGLQATLEEGE